MASSDADRRVPLGREFLVVWSGQTVSEIGSILSGVGVAIHVFVETGSPVWLGVLSALVGLPFLLVGPLAPIIDRCERRRVIIGADLVAALGPSFALTSAVLGRLEIWHLVLAGFIGSFGTAVQVPASQAAVPSLAPSGAVDRANALKQLGPAIGLVAGPAIAAPMVAAWGVESILLLDLVTFFAGVAAVVATPFDDHLDDAPIADDGSWSMLWTWLSSQGRPLLTLLGAAAGVNFVIAFFNVSILALATEVGGVSQAGLVIGAAGAAMIVGSLVASQRGIAPDRLGTFVRGLLAMSVGLFLSALRPSLALVTLGVVVALAAVPAVNAAMATLYNEQVPATMQGRMFALRGAISQALQTIGAVLAGVAVAAAAPAIDSGGLAPLLGTIIGTGRDRAAAVVLVACSVLLLLVASWMCWSAAGRSLRAFSASAAAESVVGRGDGVRVGERV